MVTDIKTLRERLGLTQAALAEAVGVHPNTVARWERGELGISAPMMDRINAVTNIYRSTTVKRSSAVTLDEHHRAILDALARRLDPETFEACAGALLRRDWPTLVPVRGGRDDGFDGAVADAAGEPFPLIVTTGEKLVDNFRRSLDRAKKGWTFTRALFATSRRITPHSRRKLYDAARTRGVTLSQLYDQDWFAQSLYREPEWCKRLLGVTGTPAALSLFPATPRPLLGEAVLGRKQEMDWLRNQQGDCLLVGEPGAGKTFLLRSLALEGHARFLVDDDRTQIANGLRSLRPAAVIVDDAHVDPDRITKLDQIRSGIKAEFRIIATSWPGGADTVRSTLRVGTANEMRLDRIDADTMVEIIKSFGIHGPDQLLYMIRMQAAGRPGLAATLAHLFRSGNAEDVLSGESLVDELNRSIGKIVDADALRLLAPFALGGDAGVKQDAVSNRLGKSLFDVSSDLARLGAAGVIRETAGRAVSVQPEPMRWVIVKRVFFDGPGSLDIEPFLDIVEVREDALRTLIGARSRGADVPDLERRLEEASLPKLWSDYASLGASEAQCVLDWHPEFIEEVAKATLRNAPERAIPMLLDRSVHKHFGGLPERKISQRPIDRAFPGGSSERPMDELKSWVNGDPSDMVHLLERRLTLVRATLNWWKTTRNGPSAIRALCVAMAPGLEYRVTDPGIGNTFSSMSRILSDHELRTLVSYWPAVLDVVKESKHVPWSDLFDLAEAWQNPQWMFFPPIKIGRTTHSILHDFATDMFVDIADVTRQHPGIQHRIAGLSKTTPGLNLDPDFEVLVPSQSGDLEDWKRQSDAVNELARCWKDRPLEDVVSRLVWYEEEARVAGIEIPQLAMLCDALADRVSDPLAAADALVARSLSSSLVKPFLLKARDDGVPGWECLAGRCLAKEEYRWIAAETVLAHRSPTRELLNSALSAASDMPSLDSFLNRSLHVMPDTTIREMLQSKVPRIAVATSVGYWVGHREKIPSAIRTMWRQAILRSAWEEAEGAGGNHRLGDILSKDDFLAVDWLVSSLSTSRHFGHLRARELHSRVARSLDMEHRKKVLARLADAEEIRTVFGVIEHLVGGDLDLYRQFLGYENLKSHHLDPLDRAPTWREAETPKEGDVDPLVESLDSTWRGMALTALDHGYSTQDVLYATIGRLSFWGSSESKVWARRQLAFAVLLRDPDDRIAGVGRSGVEYTKERERAAIDREREMAVDGRWR